MTDAERNALLKRIAAFTKAVKSMSSEEATRRLIDEGLYDKHGRLTKQYGGKATARG